MWDVKDNNIEMTEGDFGVGLPLTVSGTTFSSEDELRLTIKKNRDGEALVTKTFTHIDGNAVEIVLTAAESAILPKGTYVYGLDWYQNGLFMCNLIRAASFKVVDKA